MEEPPDDFVWCAERWSTEDGAKSHYCAEHKPGHTTHKCCCGDIKTSL